jgi:hypothetical protein
MAGAFDGKKDVYLGKSPRQYLNDHQRLFLQNRLYQKKGAENGCYTLATQNPLTARDSGG